MIFTSLGLLLVSLGLLIAGIAKSSVALLMASLACTIVAGVVLAMVLPAARRLTSAQQGGSWSGPALQTPNGQQGGSWSGPALQTANGQPVVLYVQQQPPVAAEPEPTIDLRDGAGAPPIVGYESMTAQQITKLISSGALTDEQLDALAEYERAHAGRKSVLAKLS